MSEAPLLIAGREIPGCTLAGEWQLVAAVEPKGQPRARHRFVKLKHPRYNARTGKTQSHFSQSYTPPVADGMKEAIKLMSMDIRRSSTLPMPWPQAVRIHWAAYFSRVGHAEHKAAPSFAFPHCVKPDKDNVEKAILDALKDDGVIADDCRVFGGSQDKLWVARGCQPGLRIVIEFITCPWLPKPGKPRKKP